MTRSRMNIDWHQHTAVTFYYFRAFAWFVVSMTIIHRLTNNARGIFANELSLSTGNTICFVVKMVSYFNPQSCWYCIQQGNPDTDRKWYTQIHDPRRSQSTPRIMLHLRDCYEALRHGLIWGHVINLPLVVTQVIGYTYTCIALLDYQEVHFKIIAQRRFYHDTHFCALLLDSNKPETISLLFNLITSYTEMQNCDFFFHAQKINWLFVFSIRTLCGVYTNLVLWRYIHLWQLSLCGIVYTLRLPHWPLICNTNIPRSAHRTTCLVKRNIKY